MSFIAHRKYTKKSLDMAAHVLLGVFMLVMVGCSSPDDKANRFYEKGAELLEKGELDKARIEFQNALQIKGDMTKAWYGLAQIAEQQGDWQKVFGYLNKVVDHDPKHLEAQLKLGRLFLAAGQLDKALAASDSAMALAGDNASVLALRAAVLYKLEDRQAAVVQANAALSRDPDNIDALMVLASERLAAGDADKAIEYLDRGLKRNEKNIALQLLKVQALESLAKLDSAEAIYRKLIALYPETRELRHIFAQFLLSHGRADAAEAEYRAVVAKNPADLEARLELVRFVNTVKGPQAAVEELKSQIAGNPDNNELKFALAGLYQAQDKRKESETVLKAIIEKEGGSQVGIKAKGRLASMLLVNGDKKEAAALIEDVLNHDRRNEQGLLLKAGMAVEEHKLEEAIADLRTILRDVPDSPKALLLLGRAHELAGSPQLAHDHYLKAFQASNLAAPFGMAYGEFLLKRGQAERAESVAEDVLKASPGHVPAMKLLAQARINKGDWPGAQAVADDLRKQGDKEKVSDHIMGAVYAAKKNYAESISAFRRAFDAAPSEPQSMVALVRTYLRAGKTNEALTFLNSVVRSSPDNANARLLQGQLHALKGDAAAAAQSFRAAISLRPKEPAGYFNLAQLHMRAGRLDEADKAIAEGLAAVPGDFALRVAQAEAHQRTGRFDDAILVYEQLLKERPNADVVANNLASLLSDHRTDEASLNRAHEVAQRFQRSEVPQFKDTLGWVNYRLGKANEAVPLIRDAAGKMPDLPVFRYHLGMSYLALGKKEEARKELEKALALAEGKNFLEADKVRQALRELKTVQGQAG